VVDKYEMMNDFYFKYVSLDNYDVILTETRQYVLTEVKKITKPGFALLDDAQQFIIHCPIFYNWVKTQGLEISKVAVHILEPNTVGYLHKDGCSEQSYLALNMDMQNCAGTQTKFLVPLTEGKEFKTLNGALSYTVYEGADAFPEICFYDLEKPVIFNISQPHRVYNLKDTTRISLSIRFVNNPLHLINT